VAHCGGTDQVMCGILLVHSRNTIPLEQHLPAINILKTRGPDFTRYRHHNNIFVAQTVLHITGTDEFYNTQREDFFAFNGEIYNHHRHGNYSNDIEIAYNAAQTDPVKFKHFEGPWAWCYVNGEQYCYATDPQGERCLYRYQDDDILIVASEVAAILQYKKIGLDIQPYTERHWPVHSRTPWRGIERVPPGMMFNEQNQVLKIDSIFDWHDQTLYNNIQEAAEDFKTVFADVICDMRPKESFGITFSGGLDSACVLAALPEVDHLYTINNVGKDTISNQVCRFLTTEQQARLVQLDINEKEWAQGFIDVTQRTRMPVQSWSFVGQWKIAQQCQERILFTGVGADELFGGYNVYRNLKYTDTHSASPYSYFDPAAADANILATWKQCLEFYNGDARQATLMMDYVTQISAVDLRGVDTCTSAHGVESRSPFVHPAIIKFALNLPFKYKVGETLKPIIQYQFLNNWTQELLFPKQGFSGHCNDSYEFLGIDIPRDSDRHQDWQNIVFAGFSRWCM
jgi:asparagine synthase (glutamine-hydrolysing)